MADDNTINIKVTATSDALKSGLASAAKEVESFGNEVNDLAKKAQAVDPDKFKAIAQAFNTGQTDLDEFRDGLMGITVAQSAAANEAVNLAEKSALSAGSMRELVVVGRELATGNLTRLPGSLSILATRLGGIPPAAILATGAIAAIGYALYELVDASQKAQSDLDKIQNAFTAVGAGDQFNTAQVTQYIDQLRNIPGVTEEMATATVNSFARIQNGTRILGSATQELKPFADLLGLEVPQAAKVMADALNDPAKGLQDLRKYGVELTTSQQEQIASMMAVNDVAGAQRVLLEGIAEASSHIIDTTTGMERFWNDLGDRISGVDVKAQHAREALLAAAEAADKVGNTAGAKLFRDQANSSNLDTATRNLPAKPKPPTADEQAAQDRQAQERADTLSVESLDKMNSALKEQEQHRHNIATIQQGINAAERLGDADAVRQGESALETENKRYYGNAPKPDKSEDRGDEAQAKAAAEAGDARIKTERDLVEQKQKLGEISEQQAIAQLHDLATQEHEINLQRIADMRAVYARQGDNAGLASTAGDAAKENASYQDAQNKLSAEQAEYDRKTNEEKIEGNAALASARIKTAEETAKNQAALGQISAQQELATLTSLVAQENAIQQKKFDDLAALYGSDVQRYTTYQNQKALADQKAQEQIAALEADAARKNAAANQQEVQQFQQTAQRIVGPWENAMTSMSGSTRAFQQAALQSERGLVTNFASNAARIVANWVLGENEKSAATAIGAKFRQLTEAEGTSQSVQQNIENTAKSQETDAVGVFSNVFNYLSPALGPFAAAPAAAASAAVLALSLPSAAGGMIVPNDTLAMVHENEMVLPARYTSGLTNMIDQANTGGASGSGHTFNNTFNVSGVQGKDIPKMIDAHIQKQARNGAYGGMRRG